MKNTTHRATALPGPKGFRVKGLGFGAEKVWGLGFMAYKL
jgi:hypothetical protein